MPDRPVSLDEEPPARLPVGRGTALLVRGRWLAPGPPPRELELLVDGVAHAAIAHGMPADGSRDGFWGIVAFDPPPRTASVEVAATLPGGGRMLAELAKISLEEGLADAGVPAAEPPVPPQSADGPLVAICMATFNPPEELFARQIESIRAQAHTNWLCVISDDGSDDERFAAIDGAIGDDPRFALSRSGRRLGFYRNFERALAMAPPETTHVALADQDDRWRPDKLEALLSALGDATLAYSDARAIGTDGEVISPTLWRRRRNNRTDLASMLFANTVTGAASLFRRELLDLALPFPPAPGNPYHDHWIALTALAAGELAYVERPLFDYVQHSEAVLGYAGMDPDARAGGRMRLRGRIAAREGALDRWRSIYFDEYCRTLLYARVLRMRCAERLTQAKRRALDRVLAGERSPRTPAWLAVRPLRALGGRNETQGFEHVLLRGLIWRYLAGLRSGRSRA